MPRTGARVTRPSARAPKQVRGKADPVAPVLRWLEEKGARQVKIAGVDLDGVLRGKYVSLDKFASVARGGLGFCDVVFGWDMADELYDNAQVTGWHTGYPDLQARVDLSTARMIPWEPATAAFLLDFVMPDGSDYGPSPRALLRRVGQRARALGFVPKFGSEYEFFIFRETPASLRAKGFQNLEPLDPGMFGYSWLRTSQSSDLVHALLDGCSAFGLEVEGFHTETGPGVYEIAIRYDLLESAGDKSVLFKSAVKEICARHGLTACFMSKPSARLPGCSGHVHQSLWTLDGARNTFHDPRGEGGASKTLRHYLGGQLKLMPELTALYWPTINSYKRSVENTWAPTSATWGRENRTCALRVIGPDAKAMRVEFRLLGADMNPYVGMAASLAAGLWGIEHEVEPGEPVTGNAYRSDAAPLPRNLRDAITLLDRSTVARELLGEEFVDHYLRTRTWEVRQYERAVTTWELERYFELSLTMDTAFFDLPESPRIAVLSWPTRIVVGAGSLKRLPDEVRRLGLQRPLLVTDSGVVKAGLVDRVLAVLGEAGIVHVLFDRVKPDPTEPDVFAGLEAYRTGGCDGIVALGGGSPLDAAKLVQLLTSHAPPLSRYDDATGGDRFVTHPLPPLVAIPTTAGTGSEVSRSGVAFLEDTGRKTVIFAPALLPRAAIVDPELTYGLPARATAATGLDAFTHCLEAYLSNGFHPLADAVAIDGIRRVSRSLPVVLQEPRHTPARLDMMIAAMEGAMAFQKGLGNAHALAHALTPVAGLHHGLANAVVLPSVMAFNRGVSHSRLARVAIAMGEPSGAVEDVLAGLAIDRVRRLVADAGLPTRLSQAGVKEPDLPRIAELAFRDASHQGNPRPTTEADLLGIARAAY